MTTTYGTVTDRVIAEANARKTHLVWANDGSLGIGSVNRRYAYVASTVSVWAENHRTIIADVPDTWSAEIHGAGITSYVLDIDISACGGSIEQRDRAEITQLSPTRARLTF